MPEARDLLDLLFTAEMARADRAAIEGGTPGSILMDRAGSAVADACGPMLTAAARVLVLCGPGNNGGDGFVAARRLLARGVSVRLALLGSRDDLAGDAAEAARGWQADIEDAARVTFPETDLVVDALFGAGLSRPLGGDAAALVERLNASGLPVLAVDVPSGVDGNTGGTQGPAVRARRTVTFFRLKPGHLLLPGRTLCGETVLADIGIDPAVLDAIRPQQLRNAPALWSECFPRADVAGHKYTRGHAVVVSGGPSTTGAARLSARAALRIGAGLVTVASPADAMAVNAASLTAVMVRASDGPDGLAALLADPRKNAVVLGPGLGVGEDTCRLVEVALATSHKPRAVVLDADALVSYANRADQLAALVAGAPGPVVATPHDGEYAHLFGRDAATAGSRLERARAGAARLGVVLLLKGADTVVAEPGGRASIAGADAPTLATAGSGDVLSGFVAGLLAQGMPAFEAASAAVYLHAATARRFGPGLIAEDLPDALPGVLRDLQRDGREQA